MPLSYETGCCLVPVYFYFYSSPAKNDPFWCVILRQRETNLS